MSFTFDDLRFWVQMLRNSERTIVCSREWESRIKTMVDVHQCGGTVKVVVSDVVADDQIIVLDENAINAAANQMMQRWTRGPYGLPST